MPVYSLNDQGFFDGSRAIMQGIAGYQQKKQRDLENKRWDDEFGMQRQKLDLERQAQQQRNTLDQSKFDEEKKNYEINRQLMQKKLAPPVQFDPEKHVKTLADGTRVIVDPETGTPTKVLEKNAMADILQSMVQRPGSPMAGPPPEGTNTVLAPVDLGQPVQPPQSGGPSPVMTGFGPNGPTFQMQYPTESQTVVERDVPGHGKQTFLRSIDPTTGKEKLEPYRVSESSNKIGDEALNKLNVMSLALSQLPDVERAVDEAEVKDAGGPIVGRLAQGLDMIGGTPNEHQRAFNSISARMLAPIAKGILGETGALSKDDMIRYAPMLPNYLDSPEARREKVATLREMLSKQRDNILQTFKTAGRDTSALESSPSLQVPKASVQSLLWAAKQAVKRGAEVEEVKQRLLNNGVPPKLVDEFKFK